MIGHCTGTLVSAFSVFYSGTSTRLKSKARAFAINVVVGLLQLATFVIIVGWIWSILWGMTFVQLAGMRRIITAVITNSTRWVVTSRAKQTGLGRSTLFAFRSIKNNNHQKANVPTWPPILTKECDTQRSENRPLIFCRITLPVYNVLC